MKKKRMDEWEVYLKDRNRNKEAKKKKIVTMKCLPL